MAILDSFSANYDEARAKFIGEASRVGARQKSYVHPLGGPDGKEIAIDTAEIGNPDAPSLVVLISGTHGVEGYVGSAAQIDWFRRGRLLDEDTRLLMIHALNPYGFAWTRRVNEENIDFNRNCLDFNEPRPQNSGYNELHDALCPASWSADAQASTFKEIRSYLAAHGLAGLQAAVSSGQYTHPNGLFYGGERACWSRERLEEILTLAAGAARQVVILDFHTGLGDYGQVELITFEKDGSPALERLRDFFGAGVGNAVSAEVSGEFVTAAPALFPHATVTAIAVEFGTVDIFKVLNALRADNWLHAHGNLTSPEAQEIKKELKAAFFCDRDDWKGMVLGQSQMVIRQALSGLKSSGTPIDVSA